MGSVEVVEVFPDLEFLLQINIVSIGEQLIEFLLISQMGSFDFTVETRCPWSDINMPNAYVGQVPVKLGLELMTVVGSDRVNAKGKAFNNMVDKLNGGGLVMALATSPHARKPTITRKLTERSGSRYLKCDSNSRAFN